MSEQNKTINREQLHTELWRTPLSKLAEDWGVPIANIIKAAETMNVPRPEMGHWQRLQLGWQIEATPLPPAEATTPSSIEIQPAKARSRTRAVVTPESNQPLTEKPESAVPENLDNAHKLVKQTRKALTHDTYLHHGLVHGRSLDCPLSVEVSREQLDRALRIMDCIVKATVNLGGRYQTGPERWERHFHIGQEQFWFWISEAKKRFTIDPELSEEERNAKGYWRWDKYEWKGSGFLRINFGGGAYVDATVWTEGKRSSLESMVPEMIEWINRVEEVGKRNREREAERKKIEAERQRIRDIEWRKECQEKERRAALEKASEKWQRAQMMRHFIEACERDLLRRGKTTATGPNAEWLMWARKHADRLDPIKQNYPQETMTNEED